MSGLGAPCIVQNACSLATCLLRKGYITNKGRAWACGLPYNRTRLRHAVGKLPFTYLHIAAHVTGGEVPQEVIGYLGQRPIERDGDSIQGNSHGDGRVCAHWDGDLGSCATAGSHTSLHMVLLAHIAISLAALE